MVCTRLSRASPRMRRCVAASAGVATTRGPPAMVRRMSVATAEGTLVEMKSDLSPIAGSPRSWKPHADRRSAIVIAARPGRRAWFPVVTGTTGLHNDVHQSTRHDHHLLRRLPVDELLHGLVAERGGLDRLAARRGGHADVAAQLAVHLDHQLYRVLHQRGLVHRGPRLVDE